MKSSRYHGYGVLFTTGISPHHPDLHSNQRKSEPHSQPWRGALFITCTAAASQPQRCLSPPRPPSSPGSSCPQRETQKEAFQTPQANWSRWFFVKQHHPHAAFLRTSVLTGPHPRPSFSICLTAGQGNIETETKEQRVPVGLFARGSCLHGTPEMPALVSTLWAHC